MPVMLWSSRELIMNLVARLCITSLPDAITAIVPKDDVVCLSVWLTGSSGGFLQWTRTAGHIQHVIDWQGVPWTNDVMMSFNERLIRCGVHEETDWVNHIFLWWLWSACKLTVTVSASQGSAVLNWPRTVNGRNGCLLASGVEVYIVLIFFPFCVCWTLLAFECIWHQECCPLPTAALLQ